MLTAQEITLGYQIVLGINPTTPQIDYWVGVTTGLSSITATDFPAVLASMIGSNPYSVVTPDASGSYQTAQTRAANYRVYAEQPETLPMMANWVKPITERISFHTDTLVGRDGSEQRIKLYILPRVMYEYEFLVTFTRFQAFQNLIYGVQGRKILVPIWAEMKSFTKTNNLQNLAAAQYLFYNGESSYEVVSLLKVNNTVVYANDPSLNVSNMTWVVPLRIGSTRDKVQIAMLNRSVGTGTIQLIMDDFIPATLPSVNAFTLEGLPVLMLEPERVSNLGVSITRPSGVVDYGGKVAAYDLYNRSETSRSIDFFGRRSQFSIRDFFIQMSGKFKSFYMPTFQNDLDIVGGTEAGSKRLFVTDVGFAKYMVRPTIKVPYLLVAFKNKPAIIVKITSLCYTSSQRTIDANGNITSEEYTGTEEIGIEVPLASGFLVSDVERVSYITLTRFSSDALEVSWINPEWFRVSVSFTGILNTK